MHFLFTRLAPAMALSLPLLAIAQQSATPADPPKAPAATLPYHSAFADYKPWQDIKPGNWRQLNDALNAGAGHAGHGAPQPAAARPAPAASAAMPRHHGHHHGHQPQGAKK